MQPRPDARQRTVRHGGGFVRLGVATLLVLSASDLTPAHAQDLQRLWPQPAYEIEISKSTNQLLVKRGASVEKRYRVSLGAGGRGDKRNRGDGRTPIGTYRIVDFNDGSRFEIFMHLNYPNVKDAFFGYKAHVISRRDFDRIVAALRSGATPPQDTALGGAIGIHGLGVANAEQLKIHRNLDWTEGCIALTNSEIRELRRYVAVGTKVVINE